ncbi:hypothetical protein ES703_01759 [subsurface metagenome]
MRQVIGGSKIDPGLMPITVGPDERPAVDVLTSNASHFQCLGDQPGREAFPRGQYKIARLAVFG